MSVGHVNLLETVEQGSEPSVEHGSAQRGAGFGDLSPGTGSRCFCAARTDQATRRDAGTSQTSDHAQHAFGHDSGLREAGRERSGLGRKKAIPAADAARPTESIGKKRTSRRAAPIAADD